MLFKLLLIFTLISVSWALGRPRGVSAAKASFYQPGKDFTCITSGESFPWEFVNDDYCDCKDGSDEPGTSACASGFFYCENRGHRGTYIVSSRVNDGICDCCDGSDEFDELIKCVNICEKLGRKEREEREAFLLLQEQGYKVKQEYIQQGKRTKDEKRAKLSELEKQLPELTAVRDELQEKKEQAEAPEKEAKEKHEKVWEAYKAGREAEKDRVRSIRGFADLDVNNDRRVDYVEIQKQMDFDTDSDGAVTVEEARAYLEDKDSVDMETFKKNVWPKIKHLDLFKPQPLPKPPGPTATEPDALPRPSSSPQDENEHEEEEEEEAEEDKDFFEDGDDKNGENKEQNAKGEEQEEKMPDYNEETQKLIEVADAARKEYNDADGKVRDTESEIKDLKNYLEVDYGPDEEFSALQGQCFEFTDREYTYKLCPFDKTIQKPKSGGMETNLGNWGHWYGPEEDKYDAMKYENGQSCWNGPNRSCHVNLHCGTENQLTAASEPSRCEYHFEFTTPARCKQAQVPAAHHEHVEL